MNRQTIASFLSLLSLTGIAVVLPIKPSNAQVPVRFFCGQSQGAPATMVERVNKSKPASVIVRWTSDYFTASGFSPAKRCAMVSQKFQEAYARNQNFVFTTSIENGLPVVCSAESRGGACTTMLYTIKKGKQDPILTMLRLEKVRSGASGALNESSAGASEQAYVGVQDVIANVLNNAPEGVTSAPQSVASPMNTPLPVTPKPLSLW
jgi:hypothetical protein